MFINDEFLLKSDIAKSLYQEVKDLPIVDYHNHLNPKEIYDNLPYVNIGAIWLDHDHYKWRLMRNSGVMESTITGHTDYSLKFYAFVKSIEKAYLNPLYHWSHMELKKYFGIDEVITRKNAEELYHKINETLLEKPRGPRELLVDSNVEVVCTTDAVEDDLKYHRLLVEEGFSVKVLPTFRPDKVMRANGVDFISTLKLLSELESLEIFTINDFEKILLNRLNHFENHGCVIADHGLSTFNYHKVSKEEANAILVRRLSSEVVSLEDEEKLKIYLLKFFMTEYAKRGWTTQLHIGAIRNTNEKMYELLGPDAGCDSISDHVYIDDLNNLLSELDATDSLSRVIVYNLNPRDNEAIASLCGNFASKVEGKIQLGAPWWFNDHYNGIVDHLDVFSAYSNISLFTGMLTDSRSYLSFVRHDYFRRILCNYIGEKVVNGFIPNDEENLKELVQNISYYNSKNYLKL